MTRARLDKRDVRQMRVSATDPARRAPPRRRLGVQAVSVGTLLAMLAPVEANARPKCMDAVTAALDGGRPQDAVRAAEAGLADPRCAHQQTDLRVTRVLALHEVARAQGGIRWCEVRDGYATVLSVDHPIYTPVIRAGLEQSEAQCRLANDVPACPQCPTCPEPPPPPPDSGPWVLVWSGVGVAALVGGGLLTAASVYSDRGDATATGRSYFDDREVASGLYAGAVTGFAVGAAMAAGGLVWLGMDDRLELPWVSAGPGGVVVGGRF